MGLEFDGVNGIIKNTTSDGDVTIKGNDGGSEVTAMSFDMSAAGIATLTAGLKLTGTTPTLTIGDGGAEDTALIFDGNAQNFYIGLDDSADDLLIGLGSTVGTTPAIAINENNKVTLPDGQMEIIIDGNYDNLTLISTDADENSGPNLRLYRNSSSPADNDLLGFISIDGRNDNSEDVTYARIQYLIKDASDGTEDAQIDIPVMQAGTRRSRFKSDNAETVINEDGVNIDFRVEGDGNTAMIMVDAGNDRLGVGVAAPDRHRLHVASDDGNNHIAKFVHTDGNPEGIKIVFGNAAPDNTTANFFECIDTGATRLIISGEGDVTNHDNSYGSISDERIKEQVADASSQWNDIKAIKVRKYKMKEDVAAKGDSDDLWQIGVVAQELETAGMNGLVKEEVTDGDTIKQYKTVKYSVLYMKAIKALQEAMDRIETLEAKVNELEG